MTKRLRFSVCAAVLVALVVIVPFWTVQAQAQAQASSTAQLDKVLAEMNRAAAKFRSARADFEWDQYERVIESTDKQTGVVYFERSGGETQMAADIETFNGQPAKKTIVFREGELQYYQPSIDQLTVINAKDKKAQYESYITLGFGGSGTDLKQSWNITFEGMEAIDGVQTAKLDLVSKSDAIRRNLSHVTIWVDPSRAISLKQELFEPSGDTRTAYYRQIQYNKDIPSSVFKIKTSSKTRVVQK
jgi:outer membrane lipoprotein-sorting protein